MVDARYSSFSERVEEKAREAAPLSYWLYFFSVIWLPWLLGMGCVTFADKALGPLPGGLYVAAAFIQWFASMIARGFAMRGPPGFLCRMFRGPGSLAVKPDICQLGSASILIYFSWWKYLVFAGLIAVLIYLRVIDFYAGEFEDLYWNVTALVFWVFAFLYAGLGLLCLIGLFVRRRLRERDGTV